MEYLSLFVKSIFVDNMIFAYGLSKLKAERYLQGIPDFPYVIYRPTGVYGPREKDYFLMAKKKDKGNFLQFLVANCDLGYSTLINRLAGRSEFHRPEIIIISEIIEGELWKK